MSIILNYQKLSKEIEIYDLKQHDLTLTYCKRDNYWGCDVYKLESGNTTHEVMCESGLTAEELMKMRVIFGVFKYDLRYPEKLLLMIPFN